MGFWGTWDPRPPWALRDLCFICYKPEKDIDQTVDAGDFRLHGSHVTSLSRCMGTEVVSSLLLLQKFLWEKFNGFHCIPFTKGHWYDVFVMLAQNAEQTLECPIIWDAKLPMGHCCNDICITRSQWVALYWWWEVGIWETVSSFISGGSHSHSNPALCLSLCQGELNLICLS